MFNYCKTESDAADAPGEAYALCLKSEVIYRFAVGLLVMFAAPFLCSFIGADIASSLHRGGFALKLFFPFVFALITFMFVSTFSGLAHVAFYLSLIFMLVQIVSLVDWAYTLNSNFTNKFAETQNKKWIVLLIAGSALMLAGAVALPAYTWARVPEDRDEVGEGHVPAVAWSVGVSLFLGLALTAFSVTNWCPHGSIFTSALVALYAGFQAWNGVNSHPEYKGEAAATSTFRMIASLAISAGMLGWTASSLSQNPDLFHTNPDSDLERRQLAAVQSLEERKMDEEDKEEGLDTEEALERRKERLRKANEATLAAQQWQYLVFVLLAFHMVMVLTNWGGEAYPSVFKAGSVVQFWMQMVTSWIILAAYAWTLLAPLAFPDRDFGH